MDVAEPVAADAPSGGLTVNPLEEKAPVEIPNPFATILGSKKALICLITQAIQVFVGMKLHVDPQWLLTLIAGTGAAHSVSQGFADIGKGKAQASETATLSTPSTTVKVPAGAAGLLLPFLLLAGIIGAVAAGGALSACVAPNGSSAELTSERVHVRVHNAVQDVADLQLAFAGDAKVVGILGVVGSALGELDRKLEAGEELDPRSAIQAASSAIEQLLLAESDDPETQARIRGAAALVRIGLRELASS